MAARQAIETEEPLEVVIQSLVRDAVRKDSKDFGDLVKVIDHKQLGQSVSAIRKLSGVMAVNVGKELGLSKCQVHFLETGQRRWNMKLLRDYVSVVEELADGV